MGEGEGGRIERTASKHEYYQVWNRSLVQVRCMKQMLAAGALGWPRGMGWGLKWEGSSGWGTHVNPWLIHVNVQQKPLQYCKVISLQLIQIIGEKKKTFPYPNQGETHSLEGISLLWPPSPGKAIKLFLSNSPAPQKRKETSNKDIDISREMKKKAEKNEITQVACKD